MAEQTQSLEQQLSNETEQAPLPYSPGCGDWQSNRYNDDRHAMIIKIAKILRKSKYNNKPINQYHRSKLMKISRKFELSFFQCAASFEEYKDPATLKQRVNQNYMKFKAFHNWQKIQQQNRVQHKVQAGELFERGNQSMEDGNYEKACELLKEALDSFYHAYGNDAANDYLAGTLYLLGVVHRDVDKYIEARDYSEKALHMYYRLYGEDGNKIHLAQVLYLLGAVEEKLGNESEAQVCFTKALEYESFQDARLVSSVKLLFDDPLNNDMEIEI